MNKYKEDIKNCIITKSEYNANCENAHPILSDDEKEEKNQDFLKLIYRISKKYNFTEEKTL